MNRRDFLEYVAGATHCEVQHVRTSGGHLIYQVVGWTRCRPGHGASTQPGMFVLSLSEHKLSRAKVEQVLKDLGLRSPWHG